MWNTLSIINQRIHISIIPSHLSTYLYLVLRVRGHYNIIFMDKDHAGADMRVLYDPEGGPHVSTYLYLVLRVRGYYNIIFINKNHAGADMRDTIPKVDHTGTSNPLHTLLW